MFLRNVGYCYTAKSIMTIWCTKLLRKIMTAERYDCIFMYTQKNTWHQHFLPQKVQDLASRY